MKFKIFNGPKSEFDKLIPDEDTLLFSEMIRSMDSKGDIVQDNFLLNDNYQTLVVYSDEYAGVNEFVIEGFRILINFYSQKYGYEEVILHNPPIKILRQLQEENTELEVSFTKHDYSNLKLKHLKEIKNKFDEFIFGQVNVKKQLLVSLYNLTNSVSNKPTVIMLYGPTSVGKTETAKLVNRIINSDKRLFRKQLSMFQNENFINYIFGDRTNSFAKDLLDRETNVILLDEFDKAHPMFYSAFYQLFDEGVYADKFYEVDLENTIILCTTNYQSEEEIKNKLGDPIYARFDHFIKFEQLSLKAKESIIERTYEEELKKFTRKDQKEIENANVKDKLKDSASFLNNAREIRKLTVQTMSYVLIEKL